MRRKSVLLLLTLGVVVALVAGCENKYPPSIWQPEYKGRPDPVITAVEPPDGSFAGIGHVKLIGKNFSPNKEENHVYFNGTEATVLSASETELVVLAPNLPADSIRIKVRVVGALLFGEYFPYRLESAVVEYGDFTEYDDAYGIACDKSENLYVSLAGKKIIKVAPDGTQERYGTTLVDKASNMKMGPDGYLYYVNILSYVFRVSPQGTDELFASLPGGAFDLDFDSLGNIYCGGSGGALYRVKPDKSVESVADYSDIYIRSVRVYNGYVYVGGKDNNTGGQAIWRNKLSAQGQLGQRELYFDWSSNLGAGSDVLSMTFAEDGDLYVGTNAPEAIVVVHPDKTFEPLYPGVLEPETYAMSWGNDVYLYVNRRSDDPKKKRILRINMQKKGAPYYGRP